MKAVSKSGWLALGLGAFVLFLATQVQVVAKDPQQLSLIDKPQATVDSVEVASPVTSTKGDELEPVDIPTDRQLSNRSSIEHEPSVTVDVPNRISRRENQLQFMSTYWEDEHYLRAVEHVCSMCAVIVTGHAMSQGKIIDPELFEAYATTVEYHFQLALGTVCTKCLAAVIYYQKSTGTHRGYEETLEFLKSSTYENAKEAVLYDAETQALFGTWLD